MYLTKRLAIMIEDSGQLNALKKKVIEDYRSVSPAGMPPILENLLNQDKQKKATQANSVVKGAKLRNFQKMKMYGKWYIEPKYFT